MRRASEILETTCLSVKEVAGMFGYEDQFYFSRMFKAVHGIPPREFRVGRNQITMISSLRRRICCA